MVEPGARTTARWPAPLLPRALGIPLWYQTDVTEIEGRAQVTGAILRRGAQEWRVPCDGIVVTGGFRPEDALLRASHLERDPGSGGPVIDAFGRCSDPAYFAAGNFLRSIETAGQCWAEGRATARAMIRALAGGLPPPAPALTLAGDALKYALPQRPAAGGAHPVLQLRVRRPARGRLRLIVDGAELAARDLSALPERRITLPMPPPGARAEIRFDEA
jgi:hypothetical protein